MDLNQQVPESEPETVPADSLAAERHEDLYTANVWPPAIPAMPGQSEPAASRKKSPLALIGQFVLGMIAGIALTIFGIIGGTYTAFALALTFGFPAAAFVVTVRRYLSFAIGIVIGVGLFILLSYNINF